MWAFPDLTIATIAFIVVVLVLMGVMPGQRLELALSLALAVVLVAAGFVVQSRHGRAGRDSTEAEDARVS